MPSGRSPRRSWKTRRQKCATKTGRLRRQRTCTSESSRSVVQSGLQTVHSKQMQQAQPVPWHGMATPHAYCTNTCLIDQHEQTVPLLCWQHFVLTSPCNCCPACMLQIYQQKVKHLLYEQQNNITTLKADTELALKLQQDEFAKREAELNRDKRALKQELREQVCQLTLLDIHSGIVLLESLLDGAGTAAAVLSGWLTTQAGVGRLLAISRACPATMQAVTDCHAVM